jgi:RecA-family ATPase
MSRINILKAFETPPPEQDFIWPGFLSGTVGAMVAPGSTGKSMFALQLACAVASCEPGANTTGLHIERHGEVLYINLEDPPGEIERRLHALGSRFDLLTRESIAKNLGVAARVGIPADLMTEKFMRMMLKAGDGKRLIIVDTLSRAHGLDENDNGAMAQLVARLEMIVRKTGASLLYLHHTSKAAALGGQGNMAQAARGASALIDNARWCGNLMKMTSEEAETLKEISGLPVGEDRRGFFVRYEIGKQNYGQVQGGQWYERTAGGVLRPVNLVKASRSSAKNDARRRDDI